MPPKKRRVESGSDDDSDKSTSEGDSDSGPEENEEGDGHGGFHYDTTDSEDDEKKGNAPAWAEPFTGSVASGKQRRGRTSAVLMENTSAKRKCPGGGFHVKRRRYAEWSEANKA